MIYSKMYLSFFPSLSISLSLSLFLLFVEGELDTWNEQYRRNDPFIYAIFLRISTLSLSCI